MTNLSRNQVSVTNFPCPTVPIHAWELKPRNSDSSAGAGAGILPGTDSGSRDPVSPFAGCAMLHRDLSPPRRVLAAALALAGPWVVATPPARAVQATVDLQENRQTARTDAATFESRWRRSSLSLQQGFLLARPLFLDLRFWAIRETTGSDATGVTEESRKRSIQPEGTLRFRTQRFQAGLRGSWYERTAEGATALPPETRRDQQASWLDAQLTATTQLSLNASRTHAEDDPAAPGDVARDQEERTGFLRARQALPGSWDFEYVASRTSSDLNVDDTKRTFLSQGFELVGSPDFADGRLRTYVRARTLLLDQTTETGAGAADELYRAPLEATLVLDDTPETLDPLEDAPVPVPELFDRNRDARTPINLGSAASVVREFGGDFRNLAFDFGDATPLSSAFLHVDRRPPNPELYVWRVFVTDDPEGRLWEELGAGRVQVDYAEIGTVVQGWQVTFRGDVAARFVKLVDEKLGPAEPELYVTELEVFVPAGGTGGTREEDSQDYRLEGRAAYDLTPEVEVGYETRLRARRFDDDGRDVEDMDHGFRSRWARGKYVVAGRVDLRRVDARNNRRNTDVTSYQLAATRLRSERLSGSLTWNRSVDTSAGRDLTTDTYALDSSFRAAPALRLTQRLSHGRRQDRGADREGSSVAVSHRVEATPVRTFTFEAERTDRWVDAELGSGFSRFSDTVAEAAWTPVPLVGVSADFRYQERGADDWNTREAVTWTPFPRGNLRPTFAVDSYYDSRVGSWEPGASAAVKWFVRRGLLAEGRVGVRRYEIAGEETLPVDTRVHVNWSP